MIQVGGKVKLNGKEGTITDKYVGVGVIAWEDGTESHVHKDNLAEFKGILIGVVEADLGTYMKCKVCEYVGKQSEFPHVPKEAGYTQIQKCPLCGDYDKGKSSWYGTPEMSTGKPGECQDFYDRFFLM